MRKKLLFSFALLLTAATGAWADGSWTSGGCDVTLVGTTLTVWKSASGNGAMENYSGNDSSRPWHSSIGSVTSIVIEEGVTSIGNHAFNGCDNLATLTVYATACTLGDNPFENCVKLSRVYVLYDKLSWYTTNWAGKVGSATIEDMAPAAIGTTGNVQWELYGTSGNYTLTISGTGAMGNKFNTPWESFRNEIQAVIISDGVTTIGDFAFYFCSSLKSVTIPASVESIGESAFSYAKLTTITIPASVESIGESAFYNCNNLATVTFEDGSKLTAIGDFAFYYCSSLKSVTIPDGVTTIGESTFQNCFALQSVTIPDCVTTIGGSAFAYCPELATVTLNSNPTISSDAFDGIADGATVTMNLTANAAGGANWMTFCSTYGNFQADANTQVFQAELNDATGALTLREIDDKIVTVSKGVILKSTGNPVMTLTTSGSSDLYLNNNLIGVSNPNGQNANGNIYVLNYKPATGVGFYKLADGKTIGCGKAYLLYDGSTTAPEFFSFDVANVTTGMSDVSSKMADVRGDFFDLQGRKVVNPTKGLYIVNGRKVVVK